VSYFPLSKTDMHSDINSRAFKEYVYIVLCLTLHLNCRQQAQNVWNSSALETNVPSVPLNSCWYVKG